MVDNEKCWSCGDTGYVRTLFGDRPCEQCKPEVILFDPLSKYYMEEEDDKAT